MRRRTLLALASAAVVAATAAHADDRVFYTPGLAEEAMAAGEVVILDFWASWAAPALRRSASSRDSWPTTPSMPRRSG